MADAEPHPSESFPEEEDLSRAGAWVDDAEDTSILHPGISGGAQRAKGKMASGDKGHNDTEDRVSEGGSTAVEPEYPPMTDEESESRRVEETLRRWETTERQRRKAARESQSAEASSSGATLVGEVAKRTSLLWPSRRNKQGSISGGTHHALRTTDDGVPLDDISASPATSARASFEPAENPFLTPAASTVSLADTAKAGGTDSTLSSNRSEEQESGSKPPPPPQPLDLPVPKSPPPSDTSPHAIRPPEPTPAPTMSPPPAAAAEEPEVRWWTEWLCGCREGGGDQSGRTNPFE